MAARRYTPEDRAAALAALAANQGNVARTARQCGVPRPTLIRWMQEQARVSGQSDTRPTPVPTPEKTTPPYPTARRTAAILPIAVDALATVFERVARLYLKRAESEEAVGKTSGKDAVIAAATATDKSRLLRDEPTAINEQLIHERLRIFRDRYNAADAPGD